MRNQTCKVNVYLKPINDKIMNRQLRWFCDICRNQETRLTRKLFLTKAEEK